MRHRLAVLLCAVGLIAAAGPVPAAAEPAKLSVAGADLVSVRVESGALDLRARDARQARQDEPGSRPGDVTFDAGGGFTGRVPDRSEYAFLGQPGTVVWMLADADGAFPALDATAIAAGRLAGDAVTLRLLGVRGPGHFHAYALSRLGGVDPLLSNGSSDQTTTTLTAGRRRAGVIWAFDAPGTYDIRIGATARAVGGAEIADEATYRVEVPQFTPPEEPRESATPPAATPSDVARRSLTAPQAVTGSSDDAAAAAQAVPVPEAAPAAAALAAAATPASGRKVIADGHVDMGPQLDGSTWTIRLRDDTASPPVWRNLSDVVLHAVDKAKTTVPDSTDYAFLGTAGAEVWILPQAQQPGIVWPGWNTQDSSVVNGVTGNVTWRLTSVSGPGRFALFQTGSFGKPSVLFDSGKALPQQIQIPPNTHAHGSWAFSKSGIYRLGVEMSGTTKAGKKVTDSKTLAIAVGAVDPNDAFTPGGGSGDGDGSGGGNGDGSGSGGRLPRTGFSVVTAGAAGSMLIAGGFVLLWLVRRRRSTLV